MFVYLLLSCSSENVSLRQLNSEIIAGVLIPAGTYVTGPPVNQPPGKHQLRREVTLTYDFLVSATEITIAQWTRVSPDLHGQFCTGDIPAFPVSRTQPVRCVSWCDAILFSNAVSTLDGLEPAYLLTGDFTWEINSIGCNERAQFVELDPKANGWRLPTEAEWEIAANGAVPEPVNHEPGTGPFDDHAWYVENSDRHVHDVATKNPNLIKIYDTSGNVFEWIWERYAGMQSTRVVDPFTFENAIPMVYTRPIKGGSFLSQKEGLSVFNRANASPSLRHETIGFRLVRTWSYSSSTGGD